VKDLQQNREFGGWIYETKSGEFVYTTPQRGTENSIDIISEDFSSICDFDKLTSTYHTHGRDNFFWSGELFSWRDRKSARDFGLDSYLGTPSGRIRDFDPASNTRRTFDPKTGQFK
jgi:hypothetical protein